MSNEIVIDGQVLTIVDTIENITIADSFVIRSNKIGTGNGEKKLYVGQEGEFVRKFFGTRGFSVKAFLLKKDLIKYMSDTKEEYIKPEQQYRERKISQSRWEERLKKVDELPETIYFNIQEQSQIQGPRIYINSTDKNFNLLRELSLPNITYISILKVVNSVNESFYYFRLFADYFGEMMHPHLEKKAIEVIEESINSDEKKATLFNARIGQGQYRKELLNLCPICPFTLVGDERVLIASHIKPWAISDQDEKVDPFNGFMLTPTYDLLFDKGFITFTAEKEVLLSPFLSKLTYSRLGLRDNIVLRDLQVAGREKYLQYHRENIFKSI